MSKTKVKNAPKKAKAKPAKQAKEKIADNAGEKKEIITTSKKPDVNLEDTIKAWFQSIRDLIVATAKDQKHPRTLKIAIKAVDEAEWHALRHVSKND